MNAARIEEIPHEGRRGLALELYFCSRAPTKEYSCEGQHLHLPFLENTGITV